MFAAIPFPDISPEIISINLFGMELALRWYAMGYIVGIAIGWQLIKLALRRPQLWRNGPPMQENQLEDLLTYIVIGVIAGGRLGYILFYKPSEFLSNPLDIIKIWEGGLSFHGGFLGVILAVAAKRFHCLILQTSLQSPQRPRSCWCVAQTLSMPNSGDAPQICLGA